MNAEDERKSEGKIRELASLYGKKLDRLEAILDRKKDCVLHPQNAEDIDKFMENIPHTINEKGQPIAKGEILLMLIPPKPKSSQARLISKYRKI